jgi:hypothetical protein
MYDRREHQRYLLKQSVMSDRRRHQRYLLKQSCYLTNVASVGTIVDICMGGLTCMCMEENKCGKDSQEKGVDIFSGKDTLLAQGLPVKVLDSIVVSGKVHKEVKFRKCHLKFEQLEQSQKTDLEEIIISYAIL